MNSNQDNSAMDRPSGGDKVPPRPQVTADSGQAGSVPRMAPASLSAGQKKTATRSPSGRMNLVSPAFLVTDAELDELERIFQDVEKVKVPIFQRPDLKEEVDLSNVKPTEPADPPRVSRNLKKQEYCDSATLRERFFPKVIKEDPGTSGAAEAGTADCNVKAASPLSPLRPQNPVNFYHEGTPEESERRIATKVTASADKASASGSKKPASDVGKSASVPEKPASDLGKSASDPEKPASDHGKSASDPEKPASDHGKSASVPKKPASDLGKSASDPKKPASDLGKSASISGKPASDHGKSASVPKKPASDLGKSASDPEKPASDLGKSASISGKPASDHGKSASVPKKPASDLGKSAFDPEKPASDLGKSASISGKPASDHGKSASVPKKPASDLGKSAFDPEKPGSHLGKSASDPEKPASDLGKSASISGKPASDHGKSASVPKKPASGLRKSAFGPEKPASDLGKPASNTEKPASDLGKPSSDPEKACSDSDLVISIADPGAVDLEFASVHKKTVIDKEKPSTSKATYKPFGAPLSAKKTLIFDKFDNDFDTSDEDDDYQKKDVPWATLPGTPMTDDQFAALAKSCRPALDMGTKLIEEDEERERRAARRLARPKAADPRTRPNYVAPEIEETKSEEFLGIFGSGKRLIEENEERAKEDAVRRLRPKAADPRTRPNYKAPVSDEPESEEMPLVFGTSKFACMSDEKAKSSSAFSSKSDLSVPDGEEQYFGDDEDALTLQSISSGDVSLDTSGFDSSDDEEEEEEKVNKPVPDGRKTYVVCRAESEMSLPDHCWESSDDDEKPTDCVEEKNVEKLSFRKRVRNGLKKFRRRAAAFFTKHCVCGAN